MVDNSSLGRAAEILLVEDNPDDVQLTRLALQQTEIDHALHVAHDGREAMAFLRSEGNFDNTPRPDLILLDLNMPIMDGREVLRDLKQDSSLRRIPVIIVSMLDNRLLHCLLRRLVAALLTLVG